MARSSSAMLPTSPRKCLCKMKTFTLLLSALVVICTTEVTSTPRFTRQIKQCEDLEIPQAATRVSYYDKSSNLMKVQFACFKGYSLIGSSEIACKDGKWSSDPPSCIRATGGNMIDEPPPVEGTAVCPDPGLPAASGRTVFFTKNKLEVGSKMKYFCNNGYNLEGNEEIICLANGQWSGPLPFCNRSGMAFGPTEAPVLTKPAPTCPEPGSISNGIRRPEISTLDGFTYLVDAQITFECADNFHLEGAAKITCTAMGNWDQSLPTCRPSRISTNGLCKKPAKPENGDFKVILPGSKPNPPDGFYHPGTEIEYECTNDLYTLKGSTTPRRTCLLTGNWGGAESRCEINCGKIKFAPDQTSLIINGEPSKRGAWPWQVALALNFDTLKISKRVAQPGGTFASIPVIDGWGIACGAALINSQWVLTAAHCLTNLDSGAQYPTNTVMVYAGKQFRENSPDDEKIVQPRMALDVYIHNDFDFTTLEADIALILLEKPIVFTKWVIPVCLPTAPWDLQKSEVIGVIAGWGLTEAIEPSNELRQAAMKWAPPAECEKNFPEPVAIATRSEIKNGMFCGIPPVRATGSAQSCVGDSGSPLVFPVGSGDDRHWVVEGLVSWGNKGCGGLLTIFTQVRNYVNWINAYVPALS